MAKGNRKPVKGNRKPIKGNRKPVKGHTPAGDSQRQSPGLSKGDRVEAEVVDIGHKGDAVARYKGLTIFSDRGIPGDSILVSVESVGKSFVKGKTEEITTPSKDRTTGFCQEGSACGGCQLGEMSYEAQVDWKTRRVRAAVERIGGLSPRLVEETLPAPEGARLHYRNKALFRVTPSGDFALRAGFLESGSGRVAAVDSCAVVSRLIERVKSAVLEEVVGRQGLAAGLRGLLIRSNSPETAAMLVLIYGGKLNTEATALLAPLARAVSARVPELSSVYVNVVPAGAVDVTLPGRLELVWGSGWMEQELAGVCLRYGPRSFFQVNPLQAETLVDLARKFSSGGTLLDIYCGVGLFGLSLASDFQRVIGIESAPEAVAEAVGNAALNGISKVSFRRGRAEQVLPHLSVELKEEDGGHLGGLTAIVDPPRSGCSAELLESIAAHQVGTVIYVSCDPATLARDLEVLVSLGYETRVVQPVDMFPQTIHVEMVAQLYFNGKR